MLRNRHISLLIIIATISVFGTGFSSWVMTNDNATYSTESLISVGDNGNNADQIGININKHYSKSSFFSGVDTSVSNSGQIDRLNTKLSFVNNKSNSSYQGNLDDYFDFYDPKYPDSELSPYLYNIDTNQRLYQENFKIGENYIEGNLIYSHCYDIIDQTKTTFDNNEIQKHLNVLSSLLDPQNGNAVEFQEIVPTIESGEIVNFIKVYASRVKISEGSYQFRYHFFYHVTDKGVTSMVRADSSINATATDTSTTSDYPTMTFTNVSTTATGLNQTFSNLNSDKRTATSLKYSRVVNGTAKSALTLTVNSNFYSSTAGQYPDYEVIDMFKTKDDFASYKDTMLNYIQNISFNKTVTVSGAEVEIVNEDEEANLAHSIMPWFYVYASRYKVGSYYRNYHYYFFYFSRKDGNLHLVRDMTTNGYLAGNYSSTEWPIFEIISNNTQAHTLGNVAITTGNRSALSTSRYGRVYFRYALNYIKNDGAYSTSITYCTPYFGTVNYDYIDKTKTKDDFDYEALVQYLFDNNSYYKNLGTDTIENKSFIDNNYPYLYFILSRRKTADNKYYYYYVNMFYYSHGENSSNNNMIRTSQGRYITSSSSATTSSDWFSIALHSPDQASYPSVITENHTTGNSIIYFDLSYYNTANNVATSKNQSLSFFGNTFGNYRRDQGYDVNNVNDYPYDDVYNVNNQYSLYYQVDEEKNNIFNAYLGSDNYWYFTGIYFRKNYTKVRFDNKYVFNSSLYGYKEYSTASATQSGVNTYISGDMMDGSYRLEKTNLINISHKEATIAEYVFTNGSDYKKYYLTLPSIGTRTKFTTKNVFDKINSDSVDFTYHLTLRPKNDEVRRNYKAILKCFDFNLNISMKQDKVIR